VQSKTTCITKTVKQLAGEKENFSSPRNRRAIQQSLVETKETKNKKEEIAYET
jgi:hypothetical protein